MNFLEAVKLALASLYAHKLRSALTLIGITIGVMTVIAVVSLIQGLNRYVSEDVIRLGTNVFMISKSPNVIISTDEWRKVQLRKDLTLSDMEAIQVTSAHSLEVGAAAFHTGLVKHNNQFLRDVMIRGWTETVQRILDLDLISGRYLTPTEATHGNRVCLVGYDIVENLFPGVDPIGKIVYVDSLPYTIIGIARKQGAALGRSRDTWVVIPMATYIKHYGFRRSVRIFVKVAGLELMESAQHEFTVVGVLEKQKDTLSGGANPEDNLINVPLDTFRKLFPEREDYLLAAKARDQIQISAAIEEVREMLRRRRKVQADQEDDFSIFTQDLLVESWRRISGAMVIAMFIISSIGLLVGGVGVMNTMLVSVTERTQEIGVRRAVGARRINLVVQFLLEAIVLTCTGGALGILMGGGIAPLVGLLAGIPALLSLFWIMTAFSLSVVVGLVFGLYPAYRAARLNPVDALRCE